MHQGSHGTANDQPLATPVAECIFLPRFCLNRLQNDCPIRKRETSPYRSRVSRPDIHTGPEDTIPRMGNIFQPFGLGNRNPTLIASAVYKDSFSSADFPRYLL
ncbi:hypothetical protein HZ326_0363 [Fusarium oxysporum f. sp. albedinis]|nr:hypothetical protein HZ326_0363 [Fusarium oxysporum f. sp. albedinis]